MKIDTEKPALFNSESLLKRAKQHLIENNYDIKEMMKLEEFKGLSDIEVKKLKDFKRN